MIDTISAEILIAERYQLLEEVGQGGMATVFRGQDIVLEREIAIKILHPHLARESEHRQRFRREAKTIARLHHPGIVEIYDFSDQDSHSDQMPSNANVPTYLVMEFVDGYNLQTFLDKQEFPLCELAAAMVATLAEALAHAHQENIIHRDLKPENVLICENGTVKLTDFGLARILDSEAMTRTGSILGSPAYMAPEQIQGKLGDHRADIFALGIILYRLACHKHPFMRNNPAATLQAVSTADYIDPERLSPGIGRQLADIIRCALSPNLQARYESATAMHNDLTTYLHEVGLHQSKETLRRYFIDPEHEGEQLRAQILTQLKQRAFTLATNKRYSTALDRCNRALALDPNDHDIDKIIERLSHKDLWYQKPALWLAATLTLLLFVAGWWYLPMVWNSLWAPKQVSKVAVKGHNPTQSVALATPRAGRHTLRRTVPQPRVSKRVAVVQPRKAQSRYRPSNRRFRRRFVLNNSNPGIRRHMMEMGTGWQPLPLSKQTIQLRYLANKRLQIRGSLHNMLVKHKGVAKIIRGKRYTLRLKGSAPYRLFLQTPHDKRLVWLTPRRVIQRKRPVVPTPPPPKPDYLIEAVPSADPIPRRILIGLSPFASLTYRSGPIQKKSIGKVFHRLQLMSNRIWTLRTSHPYAYTRAWKIKVPSTGIPLVLDLSAKEKGWQPLNAQVSGVGFELRTRLKIKSAFVTINCNVIGAAPTIDEKPRSPLDRRSQTYSIPWEWKSYQATVEVTVTHKHFKSWSKTLVLTPGQRKTLDVAMIPRTSPKPPRKKR